MVRSYDLQVSNSEVLADIVEWFSLLWHLCMTQLEAVAIDVRLHCVSSLNCVGGLTSRPFQGSFFKQWQKICESYISPWLSQICAKFNERCNS